MQFIYEAFNLNNFCFYICFSIFPEIFYLIYFTINDIFHRVCWIHLLYWLWIKYWNSPHICYDIVNSTVRKMCVYRRHKYKNTDKWNCLYVILLKGSSCDNNCISKINFCIHSHIGYLLVTEHPAIRIQSCCFSFKFQYFLWRSQNPGNRSLGSVLRKKKANLAFDSFIIAFDFRGWFVVRGRAKLNNFKMNGIIHLCGFMNIF